MTVEPKYDLKSLYEIYKEWISEIDFFQNEIEFLELLLSQYYILINKPEFYVKTNQIKEDIFTIKTYLIHIKSEIYTQNKLLSIIIDHESQSRGVATFKNNHIQLSKEYNVYKNDFYNLKLSVYAMLKEVIKLSKQRKINLF